MKDYVFRFIVENFAHLFWMKFKFSPSCVRDNGGNIFLKLLLCQWNTVTCYLVFLNNQLSTKDFPWLKPKQDEWFFSARCYLPVPSGGKKCGSRVFWLASSSLLAAVAPNSFSFEYETRFFWSETCSACKFFCSRFFPDTLCYFKPKKQHMRPERHSCTTFYQPMGEEENQPKSFTTLIADWFPEIRPSKYLYTQLRISLNDGAVCNTGTSAEGTPSNSGWRKLAYLADEMRW